MNDTGERTTYDTGCVREPNTDKPRYDLISTEGMRRLAIHYTNGGKKYGDNNWQKGMPWSHCLASLMRHVEAYRSGDNSEDHLAAISWNAMSLCEYEKTHPELNDLPARGGTL